MQGFASMLSFWDTLPYLQQNSSFLLGLSLNFSQEKKKSLAPKGKPSFS